MSSTEEETKELVAHNTGVLVISCLLLAGLGVAAGSGLGITLILLAVAVPLGALAVYAPLELKERRYLRHEELLEEAHGQDYVDPGLLAQQDHEALASLQEAVDSVLASPLHRSGQLLDASQNTVVLRDLEWQIACDLLKASQAEDDLAAVGEPRSGRETVMSALERATHAINEIRSATHKRTDAIIAYADRVQQVQELMEDVKRAEEYSRIANDLRAQVTGGTQQDEALESLLAVQQEAMKIAQLHKELGL